MKEIEYKIESLKRIRTDVEFKVKHRVFGEEEWKETLFLFPEEKIKDDDWKTEIEKNLKADTREKMEDIEEFVGKTFYTGEKK
jgi:hypothetical protein